MIITFLSLHCFFLSYSSVTEYFAAKEEVSLSQLAVDINEGLVSEVEVSGENLEVTYVLIPTEGDDESAAEAVVKKSKKETEASFTETLVNYGVTYQALSAVNITIADPSGFRYWFLALAPLLIPIIIIVLIIWYLSRQVKGGGGMQAFTFGQSKARMVDPNDKQQKVLFKDVAGAKEAKEELLEIVDFLKSPKKFIEIGARIPKGVMLMGSPGTGKTLCSIVIADKLIKEKK